MRITLSNGQLTADQPFRRSAKGRVVRIVLTKDDARVWDFLIRRASRYSASDLLRQALAFRALLESFDEKGRRVWVAIWPDDTSTQLLRSFLGFGARLVDPSPSALAIARIDVGKPVKRSLGVWLSGRLLRCLDALEDQFQGITSTTHLFRVGIWARATLEMRVPGTRRHPHVLVSYLDSSGYPRAEHVHRYLGLPAPRDFDPRLLADPSRWDEHVALLGRIVLPCPFCGDKSPEEHSTYMACMSCGAKGPSTAFVGAVAGARSRWNIRRNSMPSGLGPILG